MNDQIIARRYARAFYEQARADGTVEQRDEDMELIDQSLSDSRDLSRLFTSPIVPRDKKASIIKQLFQGRVHDTTLRFLDLLVRKGREELFPMIVVAYRKLRDAELGVTEASVRVPEPMDDKATAEVQQRLESFTGKKVRLRVELDPDLLGGAVIRVGDTVYDGSVRNKLSLLRDQLERGRFSIN